NIITLWNEANEEKKERILSTAFVLFPELFQPKYSKKYHRLASWLVVKHQLVSPSLRDSFSAGGKASIGGYEFPRVAKTLVDNMENALTHFRKLDREDLAYYWRKDLDSLPKRESTLFDYWLTMVMNNMSLGLDRDALEVFRDEVSKWFK